jgi:hypothetical protein
MSSQRLSRIPSHPTAEDLEDGDRIQVGQDVWRILGSLLLHSGSWMFRLEPVRVADAGAGPARLLVPAAPAAERPVPLWTLVLGGQPFELPADLFLVQPEMTEVTLNR